MNNWSVKIIADSTSSVNNVRLTTFELSYPRLIHSELMTHRVFSRNAASSRAIPVSKFIKDVWSNPAKPVEWGKNAPGMQSKELLSPFKQKLMNALWIGSSKIVVILAWTMNKVGAHKQICNRILEPYQWINVVLSGTEFQNFFELRDHKDADPTIRYLALSMRVAYNSSIPKQLQPDEWHLPYVLEEEKKMYIQEALCKISAARCARVSYMTHGTSKVDVGKDISLAERLISSKHYSPLEHQAKSGTYGNRNFDLGWTQYRALVQIKEVK